MIRKITLREIAERYSGEFAYIVGRVLHHEEWQFEEPRGMITRRPEYCFINKKPRLKTPVLDMKRTQVYSFCPYMPIQKNDVLVISIWNGRGTKCKNLKYKVI
jgi:hypothetical protein